MLIPENDPKEPEIDEAQMKKYIAGWDKHYERFYTLYPDGGIDQKPNISGYLLYTAKDKFSVLQDLLGIGKQKTDLSKQEKDLEPGRE